MLLLLALGCGPRSAAIVSSDGGNDAVVERVGAAPDLAAPQPDGDGTVVNCASDGSICIEYHGVQPPADCPAIPGGCPPVADPARDICVVGPGKWEYFYHHVIPLADGGSYLYGALPGADCVHP